MSPPTRSGPSSSRRAAVTFAASACSPVAARPDLPALFDERTLDGDLVRDYDGVRSRRRPDERPYLDGASIDFSDTIEKQGFTIDNPNAGSSQPAATVQASPAYERRKSHPTRVGASFLRMPSFAFWVKARHGRATRTKASNGSPRTYHCALPAPTARPPHGSARCGP